MPDSETIDARLRSVENSATEAAKEPTTLELGGLAEARRDADEMVRWIQERCEGAGAQIKLLSATVRAGGTAFYSEMSMDSATAKTLFGPPQARNPLRSRTRLGRDNDSNRNSALHAGLFELRQRLKTLARPATLPSWLELILKKDEAGETATALDELFLKINTMLSAGDFAEVDAVLAAMPLVGPTLSLMMGLLSITRPAASQLPAREQFFNRLYRLCNAMGRNAETLLGGLK